MPSDEESTDCKTRISSELDQLFDMVTSFPGAVQESLDLSSDNFMMPSQGFGLVGVSSYITLHDIID